MTAETPLAGPVPLEKSHDLTAFDCGAPALNDYLHKYAWANHQAQAARTYVATRGSRVAGYYTLAAGSVLRDDTPPRVAKGLGNYPVPIILLARLAVDRTEQGKGLGAALPPDRWRAFCETLDAPPRDIPALRKLLTEEGIFDEPRDAAH